MSNTVHIKFFGQLAEVAQTNDATLNDVVDTNDVIQKITQQYPSLKNYTYVIALDKKIISGNALVTHKQTIALMPPFSGG